MLRSYYSYTQSFIRDLTSWTRTHHSQPKGSQGDSIWGVQQTVDSMSILTPFGESLDSLGESHIMTPLGSQEILTPQESQVTPQMESILT